jgi:mRNA interferase HigB
MGTSGVPVFGERILARFAARHAAARSPLQRFLRIAREANWPHLPALKATFPAVDYTPATAAFVFNIGGNKYRLIASIDFDEQVMTIDTVITHEQCEREVL